MNMPKSILEASSERAELNVFAFPLTFFARLSALISWPFIMKSRSEIFFFFLLQGKALIRPIAFRPTPGPNSGASTPTNGPLMFPTRPGSSNGGPESLVHHLGLARASPANSLVATQGPINNANSGLQNNEGFAPGHPLVKDGRRHYGSKSL